jgi:ribosomal protein S24E
MKLELLRRTRSDLLEREDILLRILHLDAKTPSKEELLDKVCSEFNLDKEKTDLVYIASEFGVGASKALIRVFDKKVEKKSKKSKKEAESATVEKAEVKEAKAKGD